MNCNIIVMGCISLAIIVPAININLIWIVMLRKSDL